MFLFHEYIILLSEYDSNMIHIVENIPMRENSAYHVLTSIPNRLKH